MFWRAITHHTLKTLLRAVQILAFIVTPAILLWLQIIGLPHIFFPPLIEAAAREELALDFTRMRLSLLEGLVLDGVRLRAKRLPENNEVAINRAAVSLNWRKALRGKVEINALDLRGAQLFLPVETDGNTIRTLRLTRARARLLLADGIVRVPFAQFNLQGIDIAASGQVLLGKSASDKPSLDTAASPSPSAPFRPALPPEAGRILEILESFNFGHKPPVLEIEFAAHAGHLDEIHLTRIALQAEHASYGAIHLQTVTLSASYAAHLLDIRNLTVHDSHGGKLSASGQWNMKTGEGHGNIESTLTPTPWLAQFYPDGPWNDLSFIAPPDIRAALDITPNAPARVQLIGSFFSGPLSYRGTTFGGFSTDFSWRDGDIYASNAKLILPNGEMQGDFMMQPNDVKLRLTCLGDPMPLAVLLDDNAREGLRKMELEFNEPPEIHIEASGSKLDPAAISAHGKLRLGRTTIHGSSMDRATADIRYEGLALTLFNIKAHRPEGSASGAFTYDFGQKQVRLDGIHSNMYPFNVLQWADPDVAKETKPYRFKSPPDVTVNGVVGLKDVSLTRITADFKAPEGLAYDLLDRTLNFGATVGTLKFAGRTIDLKVPSARLFQGTVKLDANINTGQPNARQKIVVNLKDVDFTALTRLYFDYKDSGGLLSGRYDFSFVANQPRLMRGGGNLLVENGNVFAIPVLGPLSVLLDAVIPGTGYQTARRATCDFQVADGIIQTENLNILGQGFSMLGQGKLYFVDDRMDFSVRVNAQGVPGVILYPVSKLFEYVSDGKMSEPVWRLGLLPKGGRDKSSKKNGKP